MTRMPSQVTLASSLRLNAEPAFALDVEPLTLFSSDKFSGSDVKVAASGVYTAYTLAGGRIRAQTVATGSRVLLQAHDAPVTDLKFSKHNAAVLASASCDGTVLVHKLHQAGDGTIAEDVVVLNFDANDDRISLRWSTRALLVFSSTAMYIVCVPPAEDWSKSVPVTAMEPHNGAALLDADISDDGFICAGLQNGSALLMDCHDIKNVQPVISFDTSSQSHPVTAVFLTTCSNGDLVVLCGCKDNRYISAWVLAAGQISCSNVLDLFPHIADLIRPSVLDLHIADGCVVSARYLYLDACIVSAVFLRDAGTHTSSVFAAQALGIVRIEIPFNGTIKESSMFTDRQRIPERMDTAAVSHDVKTLIERLEGLMNAQAAEKMKAMEKTIEAKVRDGIRAHENSTAKETNRIIKAQMKEIFENAFESFLPSFERACKEMLHQLHDVVKAGFAQKVKEFEEKTLNFKNQTCKSSEKDAALVGRLLEDSNFEDALRYVLGKGDIDLLISTCRAISIHDVFYGARSPPATDVLLSLIHQLSSEMAADVVLKARWVREAAQSLDRTQDVFEKHAQSVLADALIAIEVAYGRCSDQAAASELRSCLYVVRTQLS